MNCTITPTLETAERDRASKQTSLSSRPSVHIPISRELPLPQLETSLTVTHLTMTAEANYPKLCSSKRSTAEHICSVHSLEDIVLVQLAILSGREKRDCRKMKEEEVEKKRRHCCSD